MKNFLLVGMVVGLTFLVGAFGGAHCPVIKKYVGGCHGHGRHRCPCCGCDCFCHEGRAKPCPCPCPCPRLLDEKKCK